MKPKVLMIAYACNPEGSGEHWLGWGWAEQAAKEFNLHLITTPNNQRQVEEHARRHGVTAHFVSVPGWVRKISCALGGPGSWMRKIVWQRRVAALAEELHQRETFQIVHQTTFHTFRVPFLAARLGIPSVWGPIAGGESVPKGFGRDLGAARIGEFFRRVLNRLSLAMPSVRKSLQRATVIFVSNHTTLEFLPSVFHDKCVVVPPNALRPEDESSSSSFSSSSSNRTNHSSFHLLYVGNCVPTRALPLVFDALRSSGLRDWKLTVVGKGPALPRWQRLAARWTFSANVQFMGQVQREKLPAFYAQSDALVFPALRDSGGSSLLEAMSRGVPVICLDCGGPGEMVEASSGIKIPVRDRAEAVATLAAAFTRLNDLPDLGRTLAVAASERARSHFSWEAKRALLDSTYQRLLKK